MQNKVKYGQFYTTNSQYIIGNLLGDLPTDKIVVEPFCGKGDLLIFDNGKELYDIDPKREDCPKRDTLLNPPDYRDKLVVTNPPFLARNKNKDKSLYDLYKTSDLYKVSIKTIMDCDGGILILPLNFFCDEDDNIRTEFFNRFQLIKLNVFEETVFDDTTYTICSFSFKRKTSDENFLCTFFPSMESKFMEISLGTGYKIGNDFLSILKNQKNIGIKRLVPGMTPNSNIYLRAIDTGTDSGRISLKIESKHFWGKNTDRAFATIVLDSEYTELEQEKICLEFNNLLEGYRKKYNSLFLTNFRNSTTSYSRKRISFDVVYKLISYIIQNKL